jgi:hypothetical protein
MIACATISYKIGLAQLQALQHERAHCHRPGGCRSELWVQNSCRLFKRLEDAGDALVKSCAATLTARCTAKGWPSHDFLGGKESEVFFRYLRTLDVGELHSGTAKMAAALGGDDAIVDFMVRAKLLAHPKFGAQQLRVSQISQLLRYYKHAHE